MTTNPPIQQVLHSVVLAGCGFLASSAWALAAEQPQYARTPMAAYHFAMQDPLLGNPYEKPVWNLHDILKLPDWLALGVEQRTRYETLDGTFKPSLTSKSYPTIPHAGGGDQQIALQSDIWLQARFEKFRFATEFMDARTTGSDAGTNNTPNPPNNSMADTLEFIQAYVSWADQNFLYSGTGVEIKAGRQTMDLGSRRLVARPIYRNTVNNFTGLRLRAIGYDKWQANAFVTAPVIRYPNYNSVTPDANNMNHHYWDEEDFNSWFSGVIVEGYKLYQDINAEAYLYNLDEADVYIDGRLTGGNAKNPYHLQNPTRNRRYFTPGLRFYQKPSKGNFDFSAEGIGQFGTVNYAATGSKAKVAADSYLQNVQQAHQAWSAHLDAGYSFDLPWSPRLMLEYDYASGNKNWKNHQARDVDSRFDPLYGAQDFDFGPGGIYSAFQRSNINSPGYKLEVAPTRDISLRLQQRLVWLASANDCWGGSSCVSGTAPGMAGGKSSYVGDQLGFTARYNVNSSLNFDAGWYHLFKGEFAKTAQQTNGSGANQVNSKTSHYYSTTPGVDSDYFYVQSQLRF